MDSPKKAYSLQVCSAGEVAPAAITETWFSVFNAPQFFSLHAPGRRAAYFTYRDEATGRIVGRTHFTEADPGCFFSPLRGTFGGFDLAVTDLGLIEGFVAGVEGHLATLGAQSIEVALKPFVHAPALCACLVNVLARRGYSTPVHDLSYAVQVDTGGLTEKMQRNNQKRVRKCQREGFEFSRCGTPAGCQAAYNAVAANRASRGYGISMTYEQLTAMEAAFPGRLHYFTVSHGAKVIAGAVCIAVSRDVLYVFYWGDLPGYEVFSPVVLLAEGIYVFAQNSGFRILDIGRSTENSVPNPGLIRFKEKLGFEASLKLTFRRQL